MPFRRTFLALCLLASLAGAGANAAVPAASPPPPPHLWSGVILATNPAHPMPAPSRLQRYYGKLKHIFGYNQYDLVGESSQKLDGVNERWLTPSKDFSMSVVPHAGPGPAGLYPAKVTLFQAHRKVAEFETHLNPDSPLFIRGPQYGGGQLFIVIHMVNEPEPTPAAVAAHMDHRPAGVILTSTPGIIIGARKDKLEKPAPGALATLPPKDHVPAMAPPHPGPLDHPGPGPGSLDHFGQMPGIHGNMDSKLNRP
jgi:hypothetical protein